MRLARLTAWMDRRVLLGCAVAAGPWAPAHAAWPEKQVTMIVAFAAGGTTDVIGRMLCQFAEKNLKVPFVVENRPGAGGATGLTAAAKAPNDGYTLSMVSVSTQAINPFLYKTLGYDPVKDFDPVALMVLNANILVVRKDLPVNTMPELIALAKKEKGKLTFGSAGIGTSQHLAAEYLKTLAGFDAVHVPFKGSGAIMQNLIGGHIDFAFDNLPATTGPMSAGEIRAIAISSPERYRGLPNIPAIAETYPGFSAGSWLGMVAPKGVPREAVDAMAAQIRLFLQEPSVVKRMDEFGATIDYRDAKGFAAFQDEERAKWSKVVKDSGAKVE